MRKYKRKTTRGTPVDVLIRAAEMVENGEKIRKVARDFNIDRMTLSRFVKKKAENPNAPTGYRAIAETQQVFSKTQEAELAEHITMLADMFHGLCLKQLLRLAFSFASKNGIEIPSSWNEKGQAGRNWWLAFKARNNLSIRAPEATSFARACAFNRPVVDKFFDNLATVMDKHKLEPKDIYNTDETGCTTVQKPCCIVTERGKKQVGAITSAERGELVTVTYTISASGNVVPPMFIFPRVNYRDHFIRGAPPGSVGRAAKSGWMSVDLFSDYLDHLIRHIRPPPSNKILLVMDNHESHVSLKAVDKARENGIIILTIPPHISHRLQPLDKAVYGPFKKAFNKAADGWLRSHPGQTLTIYEIPSLVNEAHVTAMSPRNILSGFQATGIFPYNRNTFDEEDFAAASTTDNDILTTAKVPDTLSSVLTSHQDQPTPDNDSETPQHLLGSSLVQPTDPTGQPHSPEQPQPTASSSRAESATQSENSTTYVSPRDIHPLPKAQPRKRTQNRKRGRTQIITDTPNRQELLIREQNKNSRTKVAKKALFTDRSRVSQFEPSDSESSGTSESDYSLEDTDSEFDDSEYTEIIEGDFVVVKVAGKSRTVNYIARVDVLHGTGDYEGIFLRKLGSKQGSGKAVFVAETDDEAIFANKDIVCKLPQPGIVGGTARRSCQLVFDCNLSKWSL